MKNDLKKSLSVSMETEEDLLPWLPELLQDLLALGCAFDQIVNMITKIDLPRKTARILDLGCGKGALLITLASRFGFKGTGIDASEAFLETARKKAEEFQVAHLCELQYGDIREYVKRKRDFNLVIYASLGGVLGGFGEIVRGLRNMVRRNGFMIIDDGYLKKDEKVERPGYEHYRMHDQTIELLTSFGDRILKEESTEEFTRQINREYLRVMKKRSQQVIRKHREIKTLVADYMANQEVECEIIEEKISGALWLLQKQ